MKRNRFLLLVATLSLTAFGALAGCDADEDGTPIGDGSGSGDGSADGSGDAGCTDGSECADGEQCEIVDGETTGTCVPVPETPYLYVAIVSRADGDQALDTNTPGPDVDAIQLIKGGVDNFAATVEASGAGAVGDPGNNNDDVSVVVGANDAIPTTDGSEDCDLSESADGGTFWSMGGDGGYVIVSFATGIEIETGDTLNVWELADDNCANVGTARPDAYEVYITATADVASVNAAADITVDNGWALVGSSTGGGIFSQTVTLPEM